MTAAELSRAADRLVAQVAHWQAGRWSAVGPAAGAAPVSRADRMYALVQRLADLAAEAEGGPRRTVPRLGDLVLPDQLRVMADDLTASGAPADALTRAADEIDGLRRTL